MLDTNVWQREMGAIIGISNRLLAIVEGYAGHVDFPEELIWQYHKENPMTILRLAHTHPPGMTQLSGRDELTMKAWAFALYPYPVRLSTITKVGDPDYFYETTYVGIIEPKENWIKRGKGIRKFEILKEDSQQCYYGWQDLLIEKSYTNI